MVYDNLKGSFKEGKPTDNPTNQSGMMSKELSALTGAGPEGHSLAYITPEEEKLLAKATGKETITTAYGIPTYETDMTVEEMEAKLTRDTLDKLLSQAVSTAQADTESRKNITGDTPQKTDEKLTEATENQINSLYADLLKNEYDRISKIGGLRSESFKKSLLKNVEDFKTGWKDSSEKMKSLITNPFGLMSSTNKKEPQQNVTPEFNPNKDYNLNQFIAEQNELMKSKEDYYPPQP